MDLVQHLSDATKADFKKSEINEDIIAKMGVYSVDEKNITQWLREHKLTKSIDGNKIAQMTGMCAYPYPQGNFIRVRLETPIDGIKYLQPYDTPCRLYYLPGEEKKFGKAKVKILFCEGEKKTAKAYQEINNDEWLVLGSSGITTWLTEDWKDIRLKGREVCIAFDQSKLRNPGEERQWEAFFLFLWKKKAIPYFLGYDGEKLDDWLAAQSDPRGALARATEKSKLNDNIFSWVDNLDFDYIAKKMAQFHYTKNEVTVIWDRLKAKKHTEIGKLTIKAMVDDHRVFNIRNSYKKQHIDWVEVDERGKKTVIPGKLAKAILKEYDGTLIYHNSTFWEYDEKIGVWKEAKEGGKTIKSFIQDRMGDDMSRKSIVEDVFFQMQNFSVQKDEFDFDANDEMLNLKNGVLDLKTMELGEHDKDHWFTSQINANYDKSARCPKWEEFLGGTKLDDATLLRLQEWFGYCLIPDTRIEKALFLVGEAGTGKSTIIETLEQLLIDYRCAMDPSEIFHTFNIAQVRGKLVNICTDANTTAPLDDRIKKLISGESQYGQFKGRDGFTFKPFVRLVFSANDFVPTKDKSDGIFRRFDVIKTTVKWDEESRDESLKEYIWNNEMDGILNWALEGLARLKKNNFKMTYSVEMKENLDEFKKESNPLLQFIEECCEVNEYSKESKVICRDLYDNYVCWCKVTGHMSYSFSKMGRELKRLHSQVEKFREKEPDHEGKRPNVYSGIKVVYKYKYEEEEKEIICKPTGESPMEDLVRLENKKTRKMERPIGTRMENGRKIPDYGEELPQQNSEVQEEKAGEWRLGEQPPPNHWEDSRGQ